MSKSNKMNLGVFCEKLPVDSLFPSESCIFPVEFLCVLKMHHVRLFIVEKNGVLKIDLCSGCCTPHSLFPVHKLLLTYVGRVPLWSFYF